MRWLSASRSTVQAVVKYGKVARTYADMIPGEVIENAQSKAARTIGAGNDGRDRTAMPSGAGARVRVKYCNVGDVEMKHQWTASKGRRVMPNHANE